MKKIAKIKILKNIKKSARSIKLDKNNHSLFFIKWRQPKLFWSEAFQRFQHYSCVLHFAFKYAIIRHGNDLHSSRESSLNARG
jgi:hypothetical protein